MPAATKVLSIGLHPATIDYRNLPDLDEATLTARIEAGQKALRDRGFDVTSCQIPTDPDEAESVVRAYLGRARFGLVMIGGGIRMLPQHTLLFERLVDAILAAAPGIRFCFNSSPETTAEAIGRWIDPAARG